MHQQNILQYKNEPKKSKAGLVSSYNFWPGNRTGLFWKEYMDKSRNKQV